MWMRTNLLLIFIFFLSVFTAHAADKRVQSMANYDDVRAFIKEICDRNKLDIKVVKNAFEQSYFDYSVTDLMDKPAETHGWTYYSTSLLSADRIKSGQEYIKAQQKALAFAEENWQVPPHVVAAIIGIESSYGKAPFKRTAVTSLGTLAFEYPRRATYFKAELEKLFVFAHKDKTDPLNVKGSYAGAIGIPQFMPSNILVYGKDGDGDNHVDLVGSHADAIASIAYYIQKHGWVKGKHIVSPVTLTRRLSDAAFSNDPCDKKSIKTVAQLRLAGVIFPEEYPDTALGILSRLDEEGDNFFPVVFFENACPIHKYNRSLKYTAAISLLAENLEN
jgi:membrane-bound lytic murein transglycosylase B